MIQRGETPQNTHKMGREIYMDTVNCTRSPQDETQRRDTHTHKKKGEMYMDTVSSHGHLRMRQTQWMDACAHRHTRRGETYTDILSTAEGHLMMRQRGRTHTHTHTYTGETYTDNILSTAHCRQRREGEKETCTHAHKVSSWILKPPPTVQATGSPGWDWDKGGGGGGRDRKEEHTKWEREREVGGRNIQR